MNKNKKQKYYSIIFKHLDTDNLQEKIQFEFAKIFGHLIYKILCTKMNHKIFNVSNC